MRGNLKLKRCPFCGSKAKFEPLYEAWAVKCTNIECDCALWDGKKVAVAKQWNCRAGVENLQTSNNTSKPKSICFTCKKAVDCPCVVIVKNVITDCEEYTKA